MMQESQHIEWKEQWRDDAGEVLGVANAKKLLEDLPNKMRDVLGIIVAVNLREAEGKGYLEIEGTAYRCRA